MGAGEGTRGGQVIGHTSSGKPIYASHLNSTGKMVHGAAAAPGGAAPAGPYRVTHGSDGNPVGAKPGAGQKFTQLAAKANNASYDARGGSQAQHTAAAKAHAAAAGAAQGTIYAAQAHVHAAAAEAHAAAAKEAGQKGTAWASKTSQAAPFNAGPNDPVHGGSGRNPAPGTARSGGPAAAASSLRASMKAVPSGAARATGRAQELGFNANQHTAGMGQQFNTLKYSHDKGAEMHRAAADAYHAAGNAAKDAEHSKMEMAHRKGAAAGNDPVMHRQAAEQFRALGQEALAASHDRHADTIMEHLESSGGTRRRSPASGRMGQGVGGPLK